MTDEQTARKIVSDAQYDGYLNDDVSSAPLEAAIVRALQAVRLEGMDANDVELVPPAPQVVAKLPLKAPLGHIIDDTGTVRRVLGTFVLTEDGAVACEEGTCWCTVRATEDDPWTVRKCRRSGNPEDYGCWWQVDEWSDFGGCIVGNVYSTREAAQAAADAKEAK